MGESAKHARANSAIAGQVIFDIVFIGFYSRLFFLSTGFPVGGFKMKLTDQFGSSVVCVNEPIAQG
jgi:hypothetical protein